MSNPSSLQPFTFTGVHHVALVCRDMAETVDFYEGLLGMRLVKAIGFTGGRGQHFFFDCGNGATLAFMWFADAPPAAPGVASQHMDTGRYGTATAHASMNHLAIGIPLEKFDEYADALRARGLDVQVINHNDRPTPDSGDLHPDTWVRSMYFRDPNGIKLEFAAYTREFGPEDIGLAPFNANGEPIASRETVHA